MIFQNYALWPHMTVKENIAYGLKIRKIPKKRNRRKKIMNLINKLQFEGQEINIQDNYLVVNNKELL